MYLLRTTDATLHHYNGSKDVKYAILSHVWANPAEENSFADIVRIAEECARTGENPRDRVCDKIRLCCIFAEQAGYDWVWIDTCCIDHNSSAELSEAINSMFAWYADADVCYAYLYDVGDEDPAALDSTFRLSRWFERGWTLQELIAPARVIFLSQNWRTMGSKHMLAPVVEDLTGIHCDILTHKQSLESVSVAQRMSWAARRKTTRVEDRAYSLLGIFGINIPTIYGEGERAFIRLQEEILRRIPEQTIFAWGPLHENVVEARELMERDRFGAEHRTNDPRNTAFGVQARLQDLLAPSPSEFADAAGIKPISVDEAAARFGVTARMPQYKFTSYGIQFHIPLSEYSIESWKSWMARTGTATTQHVQVGLLACEDAFGDLIVLFLRRANNPTSGPQYAVGEFIDGTEEMHYHRGAIFPNDLVESEARIGRQPTVESEDDENGEGSEQTTRMLEMMEEMHPGLQNSGLPGFKKKRKSKKKEFCYSSFSLEEIYIHHQAAVQTVSHIRQDGTVREMMATRQFFTFTFPHWLLVQIAEQHGLLPMRNKIGDTKGMKLRVPFKPNDKQTERGFLSSVSFVDPVRQEKLTIAIGVGGCSCLRYVPTEGAPLHKLWVEVRVAPMSGSAQGTQLPSVSGPVQTMPNCNRMHVDFTMVRAEDFMIKTVFGDDERKVEIEFRKWEGFERIRPIMCQSHVITFDVTGPAYQRPPLKPPKIYSADEVPLARASTEGLDDDDGEVSVDHDAAAAELRTGRSVRFLTEPSLRPSDARQACPSQPNSTARSKRRTRKTKQTDLSLPRGGARQASLSDVSQLRLPMLGSQPFLPHLLTT